MKYDLVQLIKDRCKLLEDNPKACDILRSLLKDIPSSKLSYIDEYGMDLFFDIFIRVVNNNIFIGSSKEETLEGEDIKLTISLDNSFSLSYYNYFKTDDNHVIQSFRMSFTNGEITLANIGEWTYSKDTPKISEYIDNTLLNLHDFNYDFYKGIKDDVINEIYTDERILPDVINEIYTDERILPDAYKELYIDTYMSKVQLDINNATSEEEFDGNLFTLINKFSNITSIEENDLRRQKMTDILLKINQVLDKDYSPKERQYILLNNRK